MDQPPIDASGESIPPGVVTAPELLESTSERVEGRVPELASPSTSSEAELPSATDTVEPKEMKIRQQNGGMKWIFVRKILLRSVPHYGRWELYIQSIFICGIYAAWRLWSLAPGDSIAFMAVVAVVMTVRADLFTKAERVVWVLIAFALLYMETHAIHQDRDFHDAQQRKEDQKQQQEFAETLDKFGTLMKQNQKDFDATMARSDLIYQKAFEADENTTGGDSFAYFDFEIYPGPPPAVYQHLFKHGDSPLYDVRAVVLSCGDVTKEKKRLYVSCNGTFRRGKLGGFSENFDA